MAKWILREILIFGHISYPKRRERERNEFTYDNATLERKESQYARKFNNKVYQQYLLEKLITDDGKKFS
jgi:hypothetical protein